MCNITMQIASWEAGANGLLVATTVDRVVLGKREQLLKKKCVVGRSVALPMPLKFALITVATEIVWLDRGDLGVNVTRRVQWEQNRGPEWLQ